MNLSQNVWVVTSNISYQIALVWINVHLILSKLLIGCVKLVRNSARLVQYNPPTVYLATNPLKTKQSHISINSNVYKSAPNKHTQITSAEYADNAAFPANFAPPPNNVPNVT